MRWWKAESGRWNGFHLPPSTLLLPLAVALSCTTGCAVLLVGAGAAGGYAVSKDSVQNHFDLPMSRVFHVSRAVVKEMGLITMEDERRGQLKATVEGATVTITVKPVSEQTVELKVKARNLLIPKIDIAQAIYSKILEGL